MKRKQPGRMTLTLILSIVPTLLICGTGVIILVRRKNS